MVDIGEDLRFQRRAWIAERMGWAVMAATILAALVGFLGSGPVSRTHAADGPIAVDYEYVARYEAPTQFEIEVGASLLAGRDELSLYVSRSLGDSLNLDEIAPPPVVVRGTREHLELVFPVRAKDDLRIRIAARPGRWGRIDGRIRAGDIQLPIALIVLP